MQSIAMFNNKGGVGKTTLICNLAAYMQKRLEKKVLVIDADPQCNTTTYVLDDEQFINVYYEPKAFTIAEIVPPLENGEGYIDAFNVTKSNYFEFDLIPGNPKFAAYEDFLASEWKDVKSSDLRGIRSTMLFVHFMKLCSEYDYVFLIWVLLWEQSTVQFFWLVTILLHQCLLTFSACWLWKILEGQ